jgi:hypothetical protein
VTVLLLIALTLLAGFAAIVILVRIHAEEAENTGQLRDWGPGAWLRKPISRDSESELFADGLRWLRAVLWIAAVAFSFGILLLGLFL